jgi:phage shock protein A
MSVLDRFSDIIKANVNEVLDKMENPEKMIDQYLRNMNEDLAEVKQSTAGVMAEETRAKRLVDENKAEVDKYAELSKKALVSGNEGDARVFLAKKQELESVGAGLMTAYAAAHENSIKMREMHDKLVSDIEELKSRRNVIKSKVAVAKTQETINKTTAATDRIQGTNNAFERMEQKANRMLDEATAMADLNKEPVDEAKALEEKYGKPGDSSVDDELKKLKDELGL